MAEEIQMYDDAASVAFIRNFIPQELKEKMEIIDYIRNNEKILSETLDISKRYLLKAQNSIDKIEISVKNELTFIMNKLARRDN